MTPTIRESRTKVASEGTGTESVSPYVCSPLVASAASPIPTGSPMQAVVLAYEAGVVLPGDNTV